MGAINTSAITRLYTSGTDEYGADYGAGSSGGAPVYSPVAGKVLAYQPSSSAWEPGRLLIQAANGAVVGIGHITSSVAAGATVTRGEQVGAVGNNGSNSHIEVMYSPKGGLSRADFVGYAPSQDFLTNLAKLVAGSGGTGVTDPGTGGLAIAGQNTVGATTSVGPGSGWSIGPWQVLSGTGLHRVGWTLGGLALIVGGVYLMFRHDVDQAVGGAVRAAS
jgi:hypothetical protein